MWSHCLCLPHCPASPPSSFLISFCQIRLRARDLGDSLFPLRFMTIGIQEKEGNPLHIPSESSDKWKSLIRVREHRWINAFINVPIMRKVSIRG